MTHPIITVTFRGSHKDVLNLHTLPPRAAAAAAESDRCCGMEWGWRTRLCNMTEFPHFVWKLSTKHTAYDPLKSGIPPTSTRLAQPMA